MISVIHMFQTSKGSKIPISILTRLKTTLTENNITYLYRSGDKAKQMYPTQIILYCPIHHNVSLTDGSSHAPLINMSPDQLDKFLKSKTVHSWEFSF